MIYQTFAQIKEKVERDLDLEVEEFVQPAEFVGYVNQGIAKAESAIHKLGLEDEYFLTKAYLPLTTGEEDYSLPTPIYMNKIRSIIYSVGPTIYSIDRLRGPQKFENMAYINQYNTITDFYKYLLRNDSADDGVTLQLVPPSRETSSTAVRVWFIREAAKWVYDAAGVNAANKCDLPQIAMEFLYAFVSYKCLFKEGHPNTPEAKADMDTAEATMIATMEQMVPDDNNENIKDLSSYQDMS